MRTCDLIGRSLDWVVAKCQGVPITLVSNAVYYKNFDTFIPYNPSTNASLAYPIIEYDEIECKRDSVGNSWANLYISPDKPAQGHTALIAAMRCYVASKMGDEVEVPEELMPSNDEKNSIRERREIKERNLRYK